MARAPKFRIYYGDGQTWKGDPYQAPATNVQAIARETPEGFALMHGKDIYTWHPESGWNGCDTPGFWDYMLNFAGPKQAIFGRAVRDEQFWKIVEKATKEGLG